MSVCAFVLFIPSNHTLASLVWLGLRARLIDCSLVVVVDRGSRHGWKKVCAFMALIRRVGGARYVVKEILI